MRLGAGSVGGTRDPLDPHLNYLEVLVFLDSNFFKLLVGRDLESRPHLLRMHHAGGRNSATPSSSPRHDAGDMDMYVERRL